MTGKDNLGLTLRLYRLTRRLCTDCSVGCHYFRQQVHLSHRTTVRPKAMKIKSHYSSPDMNQQDQ